MTTVNESIGPLGKDVAYRQAQMPDYVVGTFSADDASDHVFKVDGRGKGRMLVAVANPSNKAATVTLYGMHTSDGAIGDSGVYSIGSFPVLAAGADYDVASDPFPWYLVKVTLVDTPTDNPLKTVTTWINFSAF